MEGNVLQIFTEAIKLPREQRVKLGHHLVLSLEKENLDPAERAGIDELRKRFEALEAALDSLVPVRLIFWKTRGTLRRIGPGMDDPGADEIRRRIEDIRTGAVEGIDADEVMAEMRARFG